MHASAAVVGYNGFFPPAEQRRLQLKRTGYSSRYRGVSLGAAEAGQACRPAPVWSSCCIGSPRFFFRDKQEAHEEESGSSDCNRDCAARQLRVSSSLKRADGAAPSRFRCGSSVSVL
ncbi:hypothetical protein MTO96_029177 [Rhipicephalus appendiculatus]